jgi:hypothetical protein
VALNPGKNNGEIEFVVNIFKSNSNFWVVMRGRSFYAKFKMAAI